MSTPPKPIPPEELARACARKLRECGLNDCRKCTQDYPRECVKLVAAYNTGRAHHTQETKRLLDTARNLNTLKNLLAKKPRDPTLSKRMLDELNDLYDAASKLEHR